MWGGRIARARLLLVWCLLCVGSPALGDGKVSRTARRDATVDLGPEANAYFGLEESTVVALDVGSPAAVCSTFRVPIGGETYTLDLAPHSVRSEVYQVKAQLADGSYVDIEPGPVRTLRGTVAEIEGSAVAASLSDTGLEARIILPGHVQYWIEPIESRIAEALPTQHVVYRDDDAVPSGGTCVALRPPAVAADAGESGQISSEAGGGLFFAELAIDVDHDYFLDFNGEPDPLAAIEAQINSIINAVNLQYERDVNIRHMITTIIVRTDGDPDRYTCGTCSTAEVLLNQFRQQWNSVHVGVQRDLTQLFTGRNLAGSTIGVAYLGGLDCRAFSNAYSVVQATCCPNFSCRTDLSAHELGHNWDADHCNCANPPYTMNSSLTCSNHFHETLTIPEIIAHRNSRSCLDLGDELRRIIIAVPTNTVAEDDTLQFTAIADFTFSEDQDITSEVTWSLDRSDAGSIDSSGLFTASDVDGDACVTVSVLYEFGGVPHEKGKTIVVLDVDAPLTIVTSDPPDEAIDARQPSKPDGSFPVGWRQIDLTFSGDTCLMTDADFDAGGGLARTPVVDRIEHTGQRSVRVVLQRDIEPGAWTTVTHVDSGASVQIGYLPGDVSGDGIAEPADIPELIRVIHGFGPTLPDWSTDIDRSGRLAPADVLRAVDLLNGADAYEVWNSRTLP